MLPQFSILHFLRHPASALLCRAGEVARIQSDLQVLTATFDSSGDLAGPPRKKSKKLLLYDSDSDDGDNHEHIVDSGDAKISEALRLTSTSLLRSTVKSSRHFSSGRGRHQLKE